MTIDKGKLENLLALITSRVSVMGQLGNDMEHMCETMNESLTHTQDKSKTLSRRLRSLQKEKNRSQKR